MTQSEHAHPPVTYRTLILTWASLAILTGLTVAASRIDLGPWNILVALAIAATKSTLVIFIFMNLRQETRLFRLGLLTVLMIVAIFIGLTFFDVLFR